MSESESSVLQIQSLMSSLGDIITAKTDVVAAALVQINTKIDLFSAALSDQAVRLSAISLELADVKQHLTAARPGTEVQIRGVPLSVPHDTPELLRDITREVLAHIGSARSIEDVQTCRLLANDPRPRRTGNKPVVPTFSYIATFKQPITRNHIVRLKRGHGKLMFSDVRAGEPHVEIGIFEFLPGPVYKLLRSAKEKGRRSAYEAVWSDDGRIYARKSRGSERIEVITNADLDSIA